MKAGKMVKAKTATIGCRNHLGQKPADYGALAGMGEKRGYVR